MQYISGISGYQISSHQSEGKTWTVSTTTESKAIGSLKNGRKHSVRVKANMTSKDKKSFVEYQEVAIRKAKPCWTVYDYDYSVSDKTITIMLYNEGLLPLALYSNGALYLDCDYKKCDRYLKIASHTSILIKPGCTKAITFMAASGNVCWSPVGSAVLVKGKYNGEEYDFFIDLFY